MGDVSSPCFVWSTVGSTPTPSFNFWGIRYKVYKLAVNQLLSSTAGSIPASPTIFRSAQAGSSQTNRAGGQAIMTDASAAKIKVRNQRTPRKGI